MPAALAAEDLPPMAGVASVEVLPKAIWGEAGRGRMGSEFHGERFAHDNFRHDHDHRFRVVGPFFDDDGYYDYGSNCWQSERIHTPAGWRAADASLPLSAQTGPRER